MGWRRIFEIGHRQNQVFIKELSLVYKKPHRYGNGMGWDGMAQSDARRAVKDMRMSLFVVGIESGEMVCMNCW